jgi:pantothenate kinase
VNPARADPSHFSCKSTTEKSPAKVISRAGVTSLCVTYGFVLSSYLVEGKRQGDKTFKGMICSYDHQVFK